MTDRLHVDAILVAAHRMAELQAENEQLRAKLAEHDRRDARIAQLEAQQRAPHPHAPEKCPACNWVNTNLTNYGEPSKPLWRCHSCAALDMRRVGDLDKQNQKLVAAAVDSPLTDKTTRGEIQRLLYDNELLQTQCDLRFAQVGELRVELKDQQYGRDVAIQERDEARDQLDFWRSTANAITTAFVAEQDKVRVAEAVRDELKAFLGAWGRAPEQIQRRFDELNERLRVAEAESSPHAQKEADVKTKLSDYKIADRKTMDLLNVWFAIMSHRAPREYVEATNEEKGVFYLAVCVEIDERVAAGDRLERLSFLVRQRVEAIEARVEQLENHPAGCSCTRCTG